MSDGTSIEWTAWPGYRPASWNPIKGCTNVSEGCRRCYARRMAARFSKPGQWGHGIAEMRGGDHRWTGHVELDEAKLLLPLRWRTPRVIFVNSTSDLFHEKLPDEAIDRVFAVMALCPQHRFIVLTKRAERMHGYHSMARAHPVGLEALGLVMESVSRNPQTSVGSGLILQGDICHLKVWPLPNVVLGVSVEDRSTMHRIDDLRATSAAVRMISFEPLLEDLGEIDLTGISWCVVGGESGHGARPMHPDWARSIRDQCRDAGVPFFFKQWGEWLPWSQFGQSSVADRIDATAFRTSEWDGEKWIDVGRPQWCDIADGEVSEEHCVGKVGKHRAGRLLDGRAHDEFPEISPKIPA